MKSPGTVTSLTGSSLFFEAEPTPEASGEETTEPEIEASVSLTPSTAGPSKPNGTRVDRWLCATRLFKSRSQAQAACEAGHVKVNGVATKSSRVIQVGDTILARAPRGNVVVVVSAIEEKRQGAARAKQLYEDRTPPEATQNGDMGGRARGLGRPTKADRRAICRLTGIESK